MALGTLKCLEKLSILGYVLNIGVNIKMLKVNTSRIKNLKTVLKQSLNDSIMIEKRKKNKPKIKCT